MRLSELYAGLGTRFPVYLLVTKMDLLAGFIEFFGGLDDEKRAQVWGTTFGPGQDPDKLFLAEAENLEVVEHYSILEGVEERLLNSRTL